MLQNDDTRMKINTILLIAFLTFSTSSSKKISIYNEEVIVALCFIGFIVFSWKSFGQTFKETIDERIKAIQEESQKFLNPNEVLLNEKNEKQRLLRSSLEICATVVKSLPIARFTPQCEKTVKALVCRNLNLKSATLKNSIASRGTRLQNDLVNGFNISVSQRFVPGSNVKASRLGLIREGLDVLKIGRKNSEKTIEMDSFNS